jgi:hypothetical protein
MGAIGGCGGRLHGRGATSHDEGVCFACDRASVPGFGPGSAKRRWLHVGRGVFWESLSAWEQTVMENNDWPHQRNLITQPLQPGECVCMRLDCALSMFRKYKKSELRKSGFRHGGAYGASLGRSPLQRYPTLRPQLDALLREVSFEGVILDPCGCKVDPPYVAMTEGGLSVITNDLNNR